jgi:hypothetical protein
MVVIPPHAAAAGQDEEAGGRDLHGARHQPRGDGRHAARAHADVRGDRIRRRHHGAAAHDEVEAHRESPCGLAIDLLAGEGRLIV